MIILDAIIRGAGIGIALLLCLLMLRRGMVDRNSLFGGLFGLGVASYLICSSAWFWDIGLILRGPILLFCLFNPLLFWLFARALFDDEFRLARSEWASILVFSTIVAFRLLARNLEIAWLNEGTTIILQIAGIIQVLHILYESFQGIAGDLMESRRQLRIYAMLVTGVYMVLVVIAELILAGDAPPPALATLSAAAILALIGSVVFMATELGENLLPVRSLKPTPTDPPAKNTLPTPSEHEELMKQVVSEMEDGAFGDETLTVANLAERLHVPEYKLRQAINQGLGYRNFNSFLNHYRLRHVEDALRDPEKARLPILTLALSAGFNSIAPFNRAFKAKHGLTPSEFRRAQSAETPSDSGENA